MASLRAGEFPVPSIKVPLEITMDFFPLVLIKPPYVRSNFQSGRMQSDHRCTYSFEYSFRQAAAERPQTLCRSLKSTIPETPLHRVSVLARPLLPRGRTSSEAHGGHGLPPLPMWCCATSPNHQCAALQSTACPTLRPGTCGHASQSKKSATNWRKRSKRLSTGFPRKPAPLRRQSENSARAEARAGLRPDRGGFVPSMV